MNLLLLISQYVTIKYTFRLDMTTYGLVGKFTEHT
jgi:hypothetical protein